MTDHAGAGERARHLTDIRDALRTYETSELAGVAAHLAEATEWLLVPRLVNELNDEKAQNENLQQLIRESIGSGAATDDILWGEGMS